MVLRVPDSPISALLREAGQRDTGIETASRSFTLADLCEIEYGQWYGHVRSPFREKEDFSGANARPAENISRAA